MQMRGSPGRAASRLRCWTRKQPWTGELVGLLRDDRHGEFLGGQIPAGQIHAFAGVALVEIHDGD
jgi:hypothetical protein